MRTHALMTKEAARPRLAPMQRASALRSILLGAGVQPKLRVGAVDDPAEAEADRTADRVMRMPDPRLVSSASEPPPDQRGILRRKRTQSGDEENVQRKDMQGASHAGGRLSPAAESAVNSLGPGAPLPASERAFFEPRFGHSLGHVRVHDGAQAAHAASAVNARAFALGSSVAFARGEYQPGTQGGRELMAHELAHVIRPADTGSAPLRRKVQVGTGLTLNAQGFTVTKTGDTYTCPRVVKGGLWNEIFTALLFSPRVFKIAGATNAEMNKNFLAHMKARVGVVEFAGKKKYSFGAGSNFAMNPAFWDVDASGWRLKAGADRQEAIDDLNVHPDRYAIACLAATELTMEGGAASNRVMFGSSSDITDWVPGDWGYITNVDFPRPGGIPGLEGENVIYVGKDMFWGHFNPGLEYKTLADWIAEVDSFTEPSKPRLETQRTCTAVGLE